MSNTIPSGLIPLMQQRSVGVLREEATLISSLPKESKFDVSGQKGQTINFSIPAAQTVDDVTPGATPPALTDTVLTSRAITLNRWKRSRFSLTHQDITKFFADTAFIPGQMAEAIRGLIYDMNAALFATYKDIYGYAGTAGTNPFATTINAAADVREVLNAQFCPEGARQLVTGYSEETALLKIGSINETLKRGDDKALKYGQIGSLFGLMVNRDGQRPTHTAGTNDQAYLVNFVAGYAAGTTSLVIDTGSGTIVEGDIITFAGHSQTYVADAGCTTTLLVLKNALVAAVANNEAITGKATHKVNLAYDPFAFGMGMIKPENPMESPYKSFDFTDPQTGISLRLTLLPGYHASQWEVSTWIYGVKCVDPRRASRLAA